MTAATLSKWPPKGRVGFTALPRRPEPRYGSEKLFAFSEIALLTALIFCWLHADKPVVFVMINGGFLTINLQRSRPTNDRGAKTDLSRKVFYVNHPQVSDKADFAKKMPIGSRKNRHFWVLPATSGQFCAECGYAELQGAE